jgi:hypothetical protein
MRRALLVLAALYAALCVAVLGLRWATRSAQLHAIEGA